jgi:phenylpropionate dioxygenase-like ring-hydroxylating dioxygenase large terminal subunit
MNEMPRTVTAAEELEAPVTIGTEAYLSRDYALAERDRLWRKVWLQAGRLEDIPDAGDFTTFDIHDDSIIIVRENADTIRAFHNVCVHRGRKLIDTPAGARNARGNKRNFVCGFHGWTYGLDGKCSFIPHQEDWQGSLTEERTSLGAVKVDTWGGWLWINMDEHSVSLSEWLGVIRNAWSVRASQYASALAQMDRV